MSSTEIVYDGQQQPNKIVEGVPEPDLQTWGKSLTLIANPSGDFAITAGETFELHITLVNQGHLGAIIDVYIDETSTSVWEWCAIPHQRLALSPQQSAEVVFECPVPPQATPGIYNYFLVVDAPLHYPEDTPIHHNANLQVLPQVASAVRLDDPTFSLIPATTSVEPAIAIAGQPLTLRLIVNNRDRRVDRFRLHCTDVPPEWVEIQYPEGLNDLGLVVATDSLALNPGARGEIQLKLNLPPDIEAGRYATTITLNSENHPDLTLLDILHFHIKPNYDLRWDLQTVVGRIRTGSGQFQLPIQNRGNTDRQLQFNPREEGEVANCLYTLIPDEFRLPPEGTVEMSVEVIPKHWWYRPWWGQGRVFEFYLEPQDLHRLPLPQERINGTLIWEARPWWQLLLAILLGLGAIAALIFAIWSVFFKPPTPPRILEFRSESLSYAAANDDFIYLGWVIGPPTRQIRALQIVGKSPDGSISSAAVTYDFSRGIPDELASVCTLRQLLRCYNVRTDARRPGEYIFELRLLPKNDIDQIQVAKTSLIRIAPLPIPQITSFDVRLIDSSTTRPSQRPELTTDRVDNAIALNNTFPNSDSFFAPQPQRIAQFSFQILHGDQVQTLKLIGRSPDGQVNFEQKTYTVNPEQFSEDLLGLCEVDLDGILTCQGLLHTMEKPDTYIFELQVISRQSLGEVTDSRPADPIVWEPPPPPRITTFASPSSTYRSGEQQQIEFQWVIDNAAQLQQLELRSLSPDGLVNFPKITYRFDGQIPQTLQDKCQVTGEQLVCNNLAIPLPDPGRYNFELTAIQRSELPETEPSRQIHAIAIQPPLAPEITNFQAAQSNYQAGKDTPIRLNWSLQNPQDLLAIRMVGRSPERIITVPEIIYPFNGSIPQALQNNCQLTAEQLTCINVPTSAQQPGDYIFELIPVHRGNLAAMATSMESDRIRIRPRPVPPPQINGFQINGEDAPLKYVVIIDPQTSPSPLNLSWEVSGAGIIQTELLPVPGVVPNRGNLTYPIAPQSGQDTLTLRATNTDGKQVQRSILIERVLLPQPEPAPPPRPDSDSRSDSPSDSPQDTQFTPFSPDIESNPWAPIDNPPQFN
ncbi:COG1470 family protein [Limnospira platensis]|uniref:COG1470 family protein n=1 Tax=Limnospira platensis TaxID=118562 RepID=UPI003D6E80EE